MSIATLWGTPDVLEGLAGGGGSGITSLTSPDNNLSVNVAGTVGEISLKNSITVSGTVNCSGVDVSNNANISGNITCLGTVNCLNVDVSNNCTISGTTTIKGPLSLSGNVGVSGEYLVSQGALLPIWQALPSLSGGLRIALFVSNNCDAGWVTGSGPITIYNTMLTGLTPTKNCYVFVNFTSSYAGTSSANSLATLNVSIGTNNAQQTHYVTNQLNTDNVIYTSHILQVASDGTGSSQTLNITWDSTAIIGFSAATQFSVLVVEDTS